VSEDKEKTKPKLRLGVSDKKSSKEVSKKNGAKHLPHSKKIILAAVGAIVAVAIVMLLIIVVDIGSFTNKEDSYFQIGNYSLTETEYSKLKNDAVLLGVYEGFDEELTATVADIEAAKKLKIEVTEEDILAQDNILNAPYLDENIPALNYAQNGWRQLTSQRAAYLGKVNSLESGSYEGAVFFFPFSRHLTISAYDDHQDELHGDEATIEADRQYAKQKADNQVVLLSGGADKTKLEESVAQIMSDENLNYYNLTKLFGYDHEIQHEDIGYVTKTWYEDINTPDIAELVANQNSTGVSQVVVFQRPIDNGDSRSKIVDVGYLVIYIDKVIQPVDNDMYNKFITERDKLIKI